MSKDQFDDNCKGCKPAILDPSTGSVLPENHPLMVSIINIWDQQSIDTKNAWHRITCNNSKDPNDVKLAQEFIDKFVASTKS